MTLNELRQQLKTIRLYYADKTSFDAAFSILPHKAMKLVKRYAEVIGDAPLDLYLIYFHLYINGYTQERTAEELNYSVEYIRQKNKSLLLFLQQKMNEKEVV